MRNIDNLCNLTPENLAMMLVQEIIEPDYDYDWEENIHYVGNIYSYRSPDGAIYYNEKDAVYHTIDWLLSEVVEDFEYYQEGEEYE